MSNTEKKIEVFQDLLHVTNDRLRGYEKVKEKVLNDNPAVQQWFEGLQQQTYHMQNELMDHLASLGGEYDEKGTFLGGVHRAWIDVKNTFAGDKVESTLENVVFGEKAALKAYELAKDVEGLCDKCYAIIYDHITKIQDGLNKAELLEDTLD